MFSINTFTLVLLISSIILITGQRIEYLNGLQENHLCTLNSGSFGRCRKISDCLADFEAHRRDKTVLKVCNFASNPQNHLICCSKNLELNQQNVDQTTKLYPTIRPSLTTKIYQTTTRTDQPSTSRIRTTTRLYQTTTTDRTTSKVYRTTSRIFPSTTEPTFNFIEDQDEVNDIKNEPIRYETSTKSEYEDEDDDDDVDLLDFESCRDSFLRYRNQWINTNYFGKALADKIEPANKENCDLLNRMNQDSEVKTQNRYMCRLVRGRYFIIDNSKKIPEEPKIKEGFRPNMAAIGWKHKSGKISFRCFGSIITEKFVVTAAHCQDLEDLSAPILVQVGDRYLKTERDDENAQQLRIREFTVHPNYTPTSDYHDIAMIETIDRIIFNNFVVPSCIGGIDDLEGQKPTVSGYGKANEISMNILMEMDVEIIANSECNKIYGKDQQLPNGIIDSQICVRSKSARKEMNDTCFGESGSPLQYKSNHDKNDVDYGSDLILSSYETSTVIGIQSFSTSCALDIPSVYTRLDFYTEWMRAVIINSKI